MCHSRTLTKGHVDVVTGEWAAVVSVCACVCVYVHACVGRERISICAPMEEAAVGMRKMR